MAPLQHRGAQHDQFFDFTLPRVGDDTPESDTLWGALVDTKSALCLYIIDL
jgi:hypothetical protein